MNFKKIQEVLNEVDTLVEPYETLIYSTINVFSGAVLIYCAYLGLHNETQSLTKLITLISAASYGASYGKLISEKY